MIEQNSSISQSALSLTNVLILAQWKISSVRIGIASVLSWTATLKRKWFFLFARRDVVRFLYCGMLRPINQQLTFDVTFYCVSSILHSWQLIRKRNAICTLEISFNSIGNPHQQQCPSHLGTYASRETAVSPFRKTKLQAWLRGTLTLHKQTYLSGDTKEE